MSVIIYKCTVCDREIEKPQNPEGLEIVNRCVITDGCRGTLYQIGKRLNHVRGKFPAPVDGLTDWVQRNILYTHTQSINADEWTVTHNLGINPIVNVYVEDFAGELVETEPEKVKLIDQNTTRITFSRAASGVAQFIGQSSKSIKLTEQVLLASQANQLVTNNIRVSNGNGIITVAVRSDVGINPTVSLKYSDVGVAGDPTEYEYQTSTNTFGSPWSVVGTAFIFNKTYTVHTFNFNTDISSTKVPLLSGATLYFSDLNGSAPAEKEVLILLAQDPYNAVDIVKSKVVDISVIDATNSVNGFVVAIEDGEYAVSVADRYVSDVFPHIQVLS